jgi:flagellar biosynthesis anti-sigma factor FlgM
VNINFPNSTSPVSKVDAQRVRKPEDDKSTQEVGNTGTQLVASNSEVSLSETTVQALTAQLANLPGVRQDRVQALRQAIHNGTYQVSSRQLADAIQADLFGPTNSGS